MVAHHLRHCGERATFCAMKKLILLALTVALFSGCAVHSTQAIASVRAAGVPERTVAKLAHRGSLTPGEIIALHRAAIPDDLVLRHLDEVGIDYLLPKEDVKMLRAAHVSEPVLDALKTASNRYLAWRTAQLNYGYYGGYTSYDYAPYWPLGGIFPGYEWSHRHGDCGGRHRR